MVLKFIYSEKATNFCKISTVDMSYVEIWQNFLAFSEYMNFNDKNVTVMWSYQVNLFRSHVRWRFGHWAFLGLNFWGCG